MSDHRSRDEEVQRAVFVIAGLLFVPIVILSVIFWITQTVGPWLWVVVLGSLTAAGFYIAHRFKNSAPVVRSGHEHELLQRIAQAELQQRALPHSLPRTELERMLVSKGILFDPATFDEMARVGGRLFELEFLSPLPSLPGVPIAAERVYDIEYDRRTLRKGEEPPYRLQTDVKGRPTSPDLLDFEAWLHGYTASTVNPEATITLFLMGFADIVARAVEGVPLIQRGRSSFTVPLIDMLPAAQKTIGDVVNVAFEKRVKRWHHFSTIRTAYNWNRTRASRTKVRARDLETGEVLDVRSFPGTAQEALDAYLVGSPLHDLPSAGGRAMYIQKSFSET